ncbi:MAG: hypothetical protein COZ69_15740 [Deltaproteobacteria bacterium CG_4_8_14_3_um_filter_45_9]|jgi:hypothetical protein|nr:MAG: hypothetical protein COS40_08580 [Deltaproteobacteria bacterium CG03_land_8_20_14_0_80_45_14]PIX21264.1 MAG: hypothetical protein COZ69_15740 [Deltaproteobacteria bacterium CG_4_8_14_3_um_filter_45_9]
MEPTLIKDPDIVQYFYMFIKYERQISLANRQAQQQDIQPGRKSPKKAHNASYDEAQFCHLLGSEDESLPILHQVLS